MNAHTPPVSRRERNKLRVQERLYSAALGLFVEKGYDSTSIDEIAERADVARGTFFNYYQRKEDLIGDWGKRRRTELMKRLEEARGYGAGPTVQLKQCMGVLGRLNEEDRDITAVMLPAWVRAGRPIVEPPFVADVFADIVKAGITQGELNPDVVPERAGHMLRDLYFGALYRWVGRLDSERHESLTEELQELVKLLLDGLSVPPES